MRSKILSPLLLCLSCFPLAMISYAQVRPAAVGSDRHLWGGVEFSNFQNDYVKYTRSDGIGFYGDYWITNRFGAEGEVRLLDLNYVQGLTEKTFMGGIIANAYQYHGISAYAKFLLGAAVANYPTSPGYFTSASGSYFAYEPGFGAEYRLSHKFKVRGEYDYQLWPSAPGVEITFPRPSSGLTPSGFSVGISYEVF